MNNREKNPAMILYKYSEPNKRTLDILKSGEIWFASPIEFNDPFDGFIGLPEKTARSNFHTHLNTHLRVGYPYGDIEYGEGLLKALKEKGGGRLINEITADDYKEIEEKLKRRGILSLSETNHSILMWSHYALNHKGICIGIEIDKNNIPKELILQQVVYSETNRPIIDKKQLSDSIDQEIKLLSTKHEDWAYEKEWRIITRDNLEEDEKGRVIRIPGKIVSVDIGIRAEDDYIQKIKEAAKRIQIRNTGYSYFGFSLDFLPSE